MRRFLLIFTALLLSACVGPVPKIPAELVGIWANEGAVLHEGKWLMSGQALYLGIDGNGAVVGGPPPIGVKISATFDTTKNTLSIDLIEREKVVKSLLATYDPNGRTINIGTSKSEFLTRRSEVFDSSVKKGLGL